MGCPGELLFSYLRGDEQEQNDFVLHCLHENCKAESTSDLCVDSIYLREPDPGLREL